MNITLWKDRENKKVDPLLFSEKAEDLAKQISKSGKKKINASTQLRRFYDEVNRLNSQAKNQNADWDAILAQVHMIVAKVAYAQARELVSKDFVTLMKALIRQVKTREDLQVFTAFFEAFMGFYKVYRPR